MEWTDARGGIVKSNARVVDRQGVAHRGQACVLVTRYATGFVEVLLAVPVVQEGGGAGQTRANRAPEGPEPAGRVEFVRRTYHETLVEEQS